MAESGSISVLSAPLTHHQSSPSLSFFEFLTNTEDSVLWYDQRNVRKDGYEYEHVSRYFRSSHTPVFSFFDDGGLSRTSLS